MTNLTQPKHIGTFDMRGLNRHATVRYRCTPPNPSRSFDANSSKSVDALVVNVSESGIGLILSTYVEPGTTVGIEMGSSGNTKLPYVDLMAIITHTKRLDNAKWQWTCEWVRKLTPEEFLVPRCHADMLPVILGCRPKSREQSEYPGGSFSRFQIG